MVPKPFKTHQDDPLYDTCINCQESPTSHRFSRETSIMKLESRTFVYGLHCSDLMLCTSSLILVGDTCIYLPRVIDTAVTGSVRVRHPVRQPPVIHISGCYKETGCSNITHKLYWFFFTKR